MEARKKILEDLKKINALFKEENITHVVGYEYKSGEPIQPLVKEQWFISTKPLAEKAIEVLEKDEIKFTPENKKNVLMEYLKNIRDRNISRQIPWGIPIPAFQNVEDPTDWIFNERVHEAEIEVNGKFINAMKIRLTPGFQAVNGHSSQLIFLKAVSFRNSIQIA